MIEWLNHNNGKVENCKESSKIRGKKTPNWRLKKQNKQKKNTEIKKKIQEKDINKNRWEVTK